MGTVLVSHWEIMFLDLGNLALLNIFLAGELGVLRSWKAT
jgi:hypothetical protein